MVEDYPSGSSTNNVRISDRLLRDLNCMLQQHNKNISDYDLSKISEESHDSLGIPKIIQDELSIIIPQEDLNSVSTLNSVQSFAFQSIMGAIERNEGKIFFVDGLRGTGKTYLYRVLLASLRSRGQIAIATATLRIAATLMSRGKTAHSRFKISLNPDASLVCSVNKQSDLSELIRRATIIIWDEATMTNRYAFEALHRTFTDITRNDLPFSGKTIIFGGDFRQVLPVVAKDTKAETINACIVNSPLWSKVQMIRLKKNMQSVNDQEFSNFLLCVGDEVHQTNENHMIEVPTSMSIPWEGEEFVNRLIEETYLDLLDHVLAREYMVTRGLLTPRNDDVDMLNGKVVKRFLGQARIYYSFDKVENDPHNLYQQEFLNSIAPRGLPLHVLKLKVGTPIMLLRNLDPSNGLCNGTRLLCRGLECNFIEAKILTGHFKGTNAFHRIPLKIPNNIKLSFKMTRTQFSVRLSFALTINKAQGQIIPRVGIYFPEHVFSHEQMYVTLSRGTSQQTTKVLVLKRSIIGQNGVYTRNVIYNAVLLSRDT